MFLFQQHNWWLSPSWSLSLLLASRTSVFCLQPEPPLLDPTADSVFPPGGLMSISNFPGPDQVPRPFISASTALSISGNGNTILPVTQTRSWEPFLTPSTNPPSTTDLSLPSGWILAHPTPAPRAHAPSRRSPGFFHSLSNCSPHFPTLTPYYLVSKQQPERSFKTIANSSMLFLCLKPN